MPYADTRGDWSQRNQRTSTDFTDQHGRKYHANIEVKSGDPVGLIEPLFRAPLMPHSHYLSRVPRRPYDVVIDYDRWKADVRTAWAEWQQAGRQTGMKLHGSAYDPNKEFTGDILDIIGPAPQRLEPVLAAQQGNRWVLGLTDRVDLRLVPYFEPEQIDPDYSDGPPEDDFSDLIEESFDPDALGGMRVPVVRGQYSAPVEERRNKGGRPKGSPNKPKPVVVMATPLEDIG